VSTLLDLSYGFLRLAYCVVQVTYGAVLCPPFRREGSFPFNPRFLEEDQDGGVMLVTSRTFLYSGWEIYIP